MKHVLMHFEDEVHAELVKKKGKLSWEKFILLLLNGKELIKKKMSFSIRSGKEVN